MIRLFTILLALIFFGQSLNKTIVYLSYLSRREYIAQNLCENRTKPEMHCNGKCHLQKQMNRQDGQVPGLPKSIQAEKESSEFEVPENENRIFPCFGYTSLRIPDYYTQSEEHVRDVFHPPHC